MGREEIEELNNFLYQVKKNFNPELVLLFGSRARNEYLKESDYDFIIVSRKFEGVHFLKRIEQILLFGVLIRTWISCLILLKNLKRKNMKLG